MIIYDWGTRPDALLFQLLSSHRCFAAQPGEEAGRLLDALLSAPFEPLAFHLNVTLTSHWPASRLNLVTRLQAEGRAVLNSALVDISKRTLQNTCMRLGLPTTALGPSAPPETAAILKSNFNYGGQTEARLTEEQRVLLGIPDPSALITDHAGYKIGTFSDLRSMAAHDESVVIERYITNAEGRYVRTYVAGAAIVVSEAINPKPIKKMEPGLFRRNLLTWRDAKEEGLTRSALLQTTALAHALGMDFGTFDFVLSDDGALFAIDVNACPGWGCERQDGVLEHLSTGLRNLVQARQAAFRGA